MSTLGGEHSVTVFNYGTAAVRTVEQNGEAWFVAKDVCDIDQVEMNLINLNSKMEEELRISNERIYADNAAMYQSNMLLETDREKLKGYLNTINTAYDENELDDAHHAHLVKFYKTMLQDDLNVVEDPRDEIALTANALQGKLKISDVYNATGVRIRRDTALRILSTIERVKARQEALSQEGSRVAGQRFEQAYNQNMQQLYTLYYGETKDPQTWGMVQDHYNSLVFGGDPKFKDNPLAAKSEIIKTYGYDGSLINNPYKNEVEAAKAFRAAEAKYKAKQLSHSEWMNVIKHFKPWAEKVKFSQPSTRKPATR